jgi:hypothetical protein
VDKVTLLTAHSYMPMVVQQAEQVLALLAAVVVVQLAIVA